VLLAGLVYLWRIGALEWGSIGRRSVERRRNTPRRDADEG
jgi:hypothetical protein